MDRTRRAASALKALSGLELQVQGNGQQKLLRVSHGRGMFEAGVEEWSRFDGARLAEIMTEPPRMVVVADYFSRMQAQVLREANIPYVDTCGNAYLESQDFFILVEGQHPPVRVDRDPTPGRAFQPAGLKVLFLILSNPARVNETYRDLARRSDTATTTVKYVLDDLERSRNMIKIGRGRTMRRRLLNIPELAKRWAVGYGDLLRPRLLRGRYRFLDEHRKEHWQQVDLEAAGACWGGEPAADVYTRYLRPERLALYSSVPLSQLARSLRIVPNPDGPIEILDKFWQDDIEAIDGQLVAPRLLVYADLLASGITRNLEVARQIFTEWSDGKGA